MHTGSSSSSSSILPPPPASNLPKSQIQAKRILYVKSVIRLLRLCGSKHQQLLSHKDGLKSFYAAVSQLLALIESTTTYYGGGGVDDDGEYRSNETVNLMIEVIGTFQVQGEFTSRIMAEAMIVWQSNGQTVGSVIVASTLNAIGTCKTFSNNLLILLEATIFNYFRGQGLTWLPSKKKK